MDEESEIRIKIKPSDQLVQNQTIRPTADEANDLLSNGILVETSKGLVCMSLNDALSSGLNLSVEDLQNVAVQLINQQNVIPIVKNSPKSHGALQQHSNFDSDGFSSECSDISTTMSSSNVPSTFVNFSALTNDSANISICDSQLQSIINSRPKLVSVGSLNLDQGSAVIGNNAAEIIKTESTSIANCDKSIVSTGSVPVIASSSSSGNGNKSNGDQIKPKKGRGGWPKGRKRKPELLNLPPKAPATGYNLYLNEQRKSFKDSALAFHEITKIIGNKWSSLSLEEKKPYLGKAEEDKKRYREELKAYRQSDAYQAYLSKKRKKRLQNNVLSESDMDATDEIDDEDNEELYCRTCDQWFHNLHNKREHLQGKQHLQSVAGDINRELGSDIEGIGNTSAVSFSTSLDESSLDALPQRDVPSTSGSSSKNCTVLDAMTNIVTVVSKREMEIQLLKKREEEIRSVREDLFRKLISMNEMDISLKKELDNLKEHRKVLDSSIFQLGQVPNLLSTTDSNTEEENLEENELNEGSA